tara:strand:+ start:87 stop:701 length:615 start_codon:yes stop_codon:yes gene_type:complete
MRLIMYKILIYLLILISIHPINASSQEILKAVTDEGREVILNVESKIWEYAPNRTSTKEIVYSNDFVKIVIIETEEKLPTSSYDRGKFKILLQLEALKPTRILRYQTHRSYQRDDGTFGSYQIISRGKVTDNFGNYYEICSVDIDGERASYDKYSNGIFFGEPKTLTITICGKILKVASHLHMRIENFLYPTSEYEGFDLLVSR